MYYFQKRLKSYFYVFFLYLRHLEYINTCGKIFIDFFITPRQQDLISHFFVCGIVLLNVFVGFYFLVSMWLLFIQKQILFLGSFHVFRRNIHQLILFLPSLFFYSYAFFFFYSFLSSFSFFLYALHFLLRFGS